MLKKREEGEKKRGRALRAMANGGGEPAIEVSGLQKDRARAHLGREKNAKA